MYEDKRRRNVAVPPLFERLTDSNVRSSEDLPSARTITERELRQAVRRELERLLNTRSYSRMKDRPEWAHTVIDYGLADYTALYTTSQENQRLLSHSIAQSLMAFEPRLRRVRIHIERDPHDHKRMLATLDGALVYGSIDQPVRFPFVIKNKEGGVEIYEGD